MILHYVLYFHHSLRICRQYTRSCVVVNVAYLPKLNIHHHLHGDIFIKENSSISDKILKKKSGGKANSHI